ncbi:hypothetical protein CPC08DRAFT_376607 [Agrocybe pediades]|nr:hypothetical protein CPC08DRAFT_376607 [Agrocybe pediades]
MAENPAPISRDGFVYYNGVFYVEVEGKRYRQEDPKSLYMILTEQGPPPEKRTKTGEIAKRQPKDSHSPGFYTAQMIFYGMKPLKTKEAAKKKLLVSYDDPSSEPLQVPERISLLEIEMAEEWRGRTNATTSKTAKVAEASGSNQKDKAAEKKPRTKQTARKTTGGYPPPKMPAESRSYPEFYDDDNDDIRDLGASLPKYRTKQTAVRGRGVLNTVVVRRDELREKLKAKKASGSQKSKTELIQEIYSLPTKDARIILHNLLEKVPPVEKALARELTLLTQSKRSAKSSQASTSTSETSAWTGLYDIHAPRLDDWSESERVVPTIEVYPSSTSAHLWASFEFGIISGIMRSVYAVPPGGAVNADIPFEWRGCDQSEGQMTFDSSNRCMLTFLGDGRLEGRMQGSFLGTVKLSGLLTTTDDQGKPVLAKSRKAQLEEVRKWKREWRGLNYHNYEVANKRRWGGWGGTEKDESAFESDTTDGHHKRDSKFNLERFVKDLDKNLSDGSLSDFDSDTGGYSFAY